MAPTSRAIAGGGECGGQVGNVIPSPVQFGNLVCCLSGYRGSAAFAIPLAASAAEVNFAREIRPMLSENCFACHGLVAEMKAIKIAQCGNGSAQGSRHGIAGGEAGDHAVRYRSAEPVEARLTAWR